MQNWNQWQLSTGAVATPMPQPPVGYAAPGADPMAMMQAYMQYYNQPAPSGYTAEQWAAAQQQNWAQWQQWQQQYQQWQAQYGEKYQETMKRMSNQNMSLTGPVPQLPQPPPPLPKEDAAKPPLPPTTTNAYQFTSMPPPHQNNLPLFPIKQSGNAQNCPPNNPPLPPSQPPLPPDNNNSSENNLKRSGSCSVSESSSVKKMKIEDEELTEAEKTFDAQFKQWEEQFNKWKQQNANHPDKNQYKQYEEKWTSWREKLIERREQMRKKREQQKQTTTKMEIEKKNLPGDDKIMNILSNTENQGLINNLLGIGKTLGLTGKQNANMPPPPPPPPATEAATSNTQTTSSASQAASTQLPPNVPTSTWNNSQQWSSPHFPNFQAMTGVPPPPFSTASNNTQMPNFTQPPPNFSVPNFSQPPPGFNDLRHNSNVRAQVPPSIQGRLPPFGPNSDANSMHKEGSNQSSMNSFDPAGNFGQKEGMSAERFARDDHRGSEVDHFRRENRNFQEHGNNQFNQQKMNFNDRFGNDRFGPGNNRCGPSNERFGPGNDRFGMGNDRLGDNRFACGNDRFGTDRNEPLNDRFGPNSDRFGPNNEACGPGSDRFNRSSMDRFDPKDIGDRRDSFPNTLRNFSRNNQFEPSELAPELKKLMEKRRAAMDVFKPSFVECDKNSSVGSLSESFKKITGDSPFAKPGNNFGPRGSPNVGPGGPGGNFRMSQGNSEFGSRSAMEIARNIPFNDDIGQFRGPNTDPQQQFMNVDAKHEMLNRENDPNMEMKRVVEQTPVTRSSLLEQNVDSVKEDKNVPLSQKPPWTDGQLPEDGSRQTDTAKSENYGSSENPNTAGTGETKESQQEQLNSIDNVNKTDVLPFMGENDPKPEDLNMEPPPELPNLGPVIDASEPQRTNEPFDMKESSLKPFPNNPECFAPRVNFSPMLGPREMQFRPNAPFPGPRAPSDVRFPMFDPKNLTPFNPPVPNSYQFDPRGPNSQFSPRGPNNMQFAPRDFPDGQFRPRGAGDGSFGPTGPADFRPRGPNDGQFGPRGPNDGQFAPRSINDGMFNPRAPNDGSFGLRGPGDNQFGPRGPNTQFSLRGPNVGNFAPRPDGLLGFRRPVDGQFGPKGSNDGQFGPPNANNRPVSVGRSNDPTFDKRGQFDPQFVPRGSNEGQSRFLAPSDKLFGTRRSDPSYQKNPSSKGMNDGQFPNRFNENTNFGSHGPNETYFGPRGAMTAPNDGPFPSHGSTDRSFDIRGKEGPINPDVKIQESGSVGGGFNNKNQISVDPNNKNLGGKPYSTNNFGEDQRPSRDFSRSDRLMFSQNDSFNRCVMKPMERSAISDNKINVHEKESEKGAMELSSEKFDMIRSVDGRQTQVRCSTVKEFCIERQFNYNHGGAVGDKKLIEHVPAKVIDYAHTSRPSIQDHLTPVQCFDYGHGNLKPSVPEHEVQPKKDFRNWEENEQNLKEYTERIRKYEYYASKVEHRRPDYRQRRNTNDLTEERRPERGRREKEDYKVKEKRNNRIFDNSFDKDQENRYEKNSNKERTRERCETSHKETSKENERDEDRSKGNINWQENLNKNVVDTKPTESSVADNQHNVLESTQKTLELAKTPNCTMVDDLLCPPGRQNRPPKVAIILRGPPGSGKSFVAKLIKDKEVEQGGSAPRILSLDDYFLAEKEIETTDDNGKKVTVKEMVYEYEEAMEQSYVTSLVKAFKKNITDGFFNFIILDCINEKISDYEEMWSFAKTKGFKVYVCEMEMDLQICLKRNIHNRTEDEINRIIDYFEPTPSYHQKLDVNALLQEQAIEEVQMEDTEEVQEKPVPQNEDSQDSQDDALLTGVSKWERMEAEDKLDRLDGLARKKNEGKVQTMKDFLQVPDYYNMEDTSGKKRVRWADLEERKEQEKMRAVGFVVGHTNWDRMMDPTKGGSALTRTKFFSLS
ncbi:uncharacterized protein LOC108625723 isoform X2 [Ceratina calcarata]|uniref:YLP motif-containing protein 1 n=1 Tax=Ceratina calcarata TaxID=156304 RepID=A0AAJ7J006_9HYME|nr:uncharacterized protein LOC108625723 isoform X2 [Ceratina calcarata]